MLSNACSAPGDHLSGKKKKKKFFTDNPQPARVTLPISCQPTLLCAAEDQSSAPAHLKPIQREISHYCHYLNHLGARRRSKTCHNWFNVHSDPSRYFTLPWKLMLCSRAWAEDVGKWGKGGSPLITIKSDCAICRWWQETTDQAVLKAEASQYDIQTEQTRCRRASCFSKPQRTSNVVKLLETPKKTL